MIDPTQIQQKSKQRYSSFLSSIITEENFFPLEFSVGTLPKDYIALREAVIPLIDGSKHSLGYGYALELKTRKTQKHGLQSLPKRISIETEQDYLKLIKKEKEVLQFKSDVELIRTKVPELNSWLYHNPLTVIEHRDRWSDLLKVCQYFQQNPKPNLYIRELPIQVHTKFVEQNQKILRSLLEAILPVEQLVSVEGEKNHTFEKRFSLKYGEHLIRLRLLDQSLKDKYDFPASDISVPVSEFRQLNLNPHRCFITENLMNFLTLPPLENSFAIFGGGYAVPTLKTATWLSPCPIFYWGDLDVDGFKILSQLRSYFPQTISIMMDMTTFEMFHNFAVLVVGAIAETLPHLTSEEETLYTHLALYHKRLEQERISQVYANQFLQNLM
ncbi:Wadjet anti-phage system protein JetD domain-containing protein [Phormidesmis priestleyi]